MLLLVSTLFLSFPSLHKQSYCSSLLYELSFGKYCSLPMHLAILSHIVQHVFHNYLGRDCVAMQPLFNILIKLMFLKYFIIVYICMHQRIGWEMTLLGFL